MAKLTQKLKVFLFCAVVWSMFSTAIFAIELEKYREKISETKESISYLLYPEEDLSDAENIENQRNILKSIRKNLPQNEKVELKDTTFEVNHDWILTKLKDFENEPFDSAKRELIINELIEKLSTLEAKIVELENQELSARSKNENRQKLDEILRRAEFQKPKPPEENFLQRLWREFWEWVAKVFPRPNITPPDVSQGVQPLSSFLQILFIVLALGVIGFVIYKFAPMFARKFKNREKRDKKTRVILGETIAADETSHNIFAEAETLAREGNLRGAIRKGYIALLCELSDRKIIGLARHKTNRDYLRDVRSRKEIYAEMNNLTGSFEKNWYGFNETEQKDWEEFRENYQKAVGSK